MTTGIAAGVVQRHARIWVNGTMVPCLLPGTGSLKNQASREDDKRPVVVGDTVDLAASGTHEYIVQGVQPRQTLLERGNRKQPGERIPVAANADTVLIVRDIRTPWDSGFIEQCVTAARRAGLQALLCVHKTDLAAPSIVAWEQTHWQYLAAVNVEVHFSSVQDSSHWLQPLQRRLAGHKVVIVGPPGAGKSTLLAALTASEIPSQPKPTTNPSLQPTANGWFVDTPGFKDMALAPLADEELAPLFPHIYQLQDQCHFATCTHRHEPHCAVKEAVQRGELGRETVVLLQRLRADGAAEGTGVTVQPKQRNHPDYTKEACSESFTCCHCGSLVVPEAAGTRHRNHCPHCLCSTHVDDKPGDRASLCGGVMDPVSVWVRKDGEWALIHRCRQCGELHSNRIAADDNTMLLLSLAVKPLSSPPFPLSSLSLGGV